MINDIEGSVAITQAWLEEQLSNAGATGVVVGLSGGVDSAVTLAIAVRAAKRLGGAAVAVKMPCGSSSSAGSRADEVVTALRSQGYDIELVNIDLMDAFTSITEQYKLPDSVDDRYALGGLRSCLRAPVLDYIAKCNNALIVGTGNRDEDLIFRYYQKRGDGAVDNNPIVAFHKSEVYQLAKFLGIPQSVIDAVPTADLWGPDSGQEDEKEMGVTYSEVEWVTREDDEYGVVFNVALMGYTIDESVRACEERRGAKYNERELEVIARAISAERSTSHKAKTPPGPDRVAYGSLLS